MAKARTSKLRSLQMPALKIGKKPCPGSDSPDLHPEGPEHPLDALGGKIKFWQATALLSALRQGYEFSFTINQLPFMEERVKMGLRSFGMSHELINSEFPQKTFDRIAHLIITDPAEYDRRQEKATYEHTIRN